MKKTLFIFFILNLINLFSQDIDSLKSAALHLPHDTDKVMLYYKEGIKNRTFDPQYSYDCAIEAENIAKRNKLPYFVARANNLLGILYAQKGDYKNALVFHKKALAMRLLINDKFGIAQSQTDLGNVFSAMKLYPQAEAAYLEAIARNYEIGQENEIGRCLFELGVMNTDLKNINGAENYFNAAIANAKKHHDDLLQAMSLNKLAFVNMMKKEYDIAIVYALNANNINRQAGNQIELASGYLNLAEAYFQKGEYIKGLSCLKTGDSLIEKYHITNGKLRSMLKHADFAAQGKNFEAAYNHLRNFNALKDSLDKISAMEKNINNFIERKIVLNTANENEHVFPYSLLVLFCAMSVLIVVFLFKFKR